MKSMKLHAVLGVLVIAASSLASAADLNLANVPVFERPAATFESDPRLPRLQPNLVEYTCASEGYSCGSGYRCELNMRRNFEDKYGRPIELKFNRTNNRFYSCHARSRRAGTRSCSLGLTPSGSGSSYYCQVAL